MSISGTRQNLGAPKLVTTTALTGAAVGGGTALIGGSIWKMATGNFPGKVAGFGGVAAGFGAAASTVYEASFRREAHTHDWSTGSKISGAVGGGVAGALAGPILFHQHNVIGVGLGALAGALIGTLASPAGIVAGNISRD
jgi:hypothetical protein